MRRTMTCSCKAHTRLTICSPLYVLLLPIHPAAVRQSFDQVEVVLYEQLSGLCRDAAWLKSYMAAELLLLKELMQVRRRRGMQSC